MRTNETLDLMRKRGERGVSAEDISKKFGFQHTGSTSKIINQLRSQGYNIKTDKKKGVYVLFEKNRNKISKDTLGEENKDQKGKLSKDAVFHKVYSKKDKILECLVRSGKEGSDPVELSKFSGIKPRNVCFHIHALRKDGHSINIVNGRYYIRAKGKNPNCNIGTQELPISDIPVDLIGLLGDKRLVTDIHKLRKEELPTYIDFLKKIIFYTKCALAMYETRNMLETLTIGE